MSLAPALRVSGSAQLPEGTLFKALDLELAPGRWTCLLGPSGVGKSTILRLIAGLETQAVFDGTVTSDTGPHVPANIAYMAQEDLLLPWASVRENVALGARLRGQKVDEARLQRLLERVGLSALSHRQPHTLSGGQRQRAALARTLMEDKPLVLLDEPFSALDARTRADMQDLAFSLLKDRTVLLVTHDPGEAARLAHKIIVMSERGLTELTPPRGQAPRAVDDPDMLAAQGQLMSRLRDNQL
ncbi:MAG: ABC transporter ATP-binding protein [Pseudomonadota bacterium]